MKEVHEYLKQAGDDAESAYEYNKDLTPHMRISRVGLPLASTLLEDFLVNKLPELPKKTKTKERANADYVKRAMSQANGYLFEQLIIDVLKQEPELEVLTQVKLTYGNLNGSCDILIVNEKEKRATVVECKALKYSTKKECCDLGLFNNDYTGYTSQLAVYKEAVALIYPGYKVDALWMVWAKGSASLFKVPFSASGADSLLLAKDSVRKAEKYAEFKSAFEAKDIETCQSILQVDELPMRQHNSFGFLAATCPVHFNPWVNALLDEDGLPYDDAEITIALMFAYATNKAPELTGQIEEKLLSLLQPTLD